MTWVGLMARLTEKPGASSTKGGFQMMNGFLTNTELLIVFTNNSFFTFR